MSCFPEYVIPVPYQADQQYQVPTKEPQRDKSVSWSTYKRIRKCPNRSNQMERVCHLCKITVTPLWRTGLNNSNLCNACGLLEKKYNGLTRTKARKAREAREARKAREAAIRTSGKRGVGFVNETDNKTDEEFAAQVLLLVSRRGGNNTQVSNNARGLRASKRISDFVRMLMDRP
jgi:GATA zinc finger